MRHILLYIACLALFALPSAARDSIRAYTVEQVPNVRAADRRQYVSDPARLLSSAARDSINATLARLESGTGIETAVVMLPSIGHDDPFEFSHRLFRHWGIGKKGIDNGLVILFVEDQRSIRFTTGYGLEGALPDAACKRIQTRYMLPAFKKGDWDTGMTLGTKAVYARLKDSMKPGKKAEKPFPATNYVFILLAILLITLLPGYLNRRRRKCPRCGKHTLRKMSSSTYKNKRGLLVRRDIYVCDNCGHTTTRDNNINDGHGHASSLIDGMIIGSMLGGGRSRGFGGGGFGGGSFGGGDSGGGGASSGW